MTTTTRKTDRRSDPRTGWTHAQRRMVIMACNAAGWNAQQRYTVMHHCGCPLDPQTKRPSIKHPRNTHEQLRMIMSFAEGPARENGRPLRPPRNQPSWEAAVRDRAADARHLARRIVAEAIERVPSQFNAGLEGYVIAHVYKQDQDGPRFLIAQPERFDQCDAPTMLRIIECLKAFVGRKLLERGIEPSTFRPPRSARNRVPTACPP